MSDVTSLPDKAGTDAAAATAEMRQADAALIETLRTRGNATTEEAGKTLRCEVPMVRRGPGHLHHCWGGEMSGLRGNGKSGRLGH